jgi:hypothetical protein
MQHHVKTAHGISKTLYRHTRRYGKFGEGQGKTLSPSNWLFTSSTLLNALHTLCTGLFITSICKKIVSKRVAEAYVDDSDCTLADQRTQDDSLTQIRDKLENIAQTWKQLLFGSGGLLSLDKTFWWLTWWDWTNGEPELVDKNKLPLEATIHLGYDQSKNTLKRKNPKESTKILGVRTNPAADFTDEYRHRLKYSVSLADRIKQANISRTNARRIYKNIWLPSLQYPLAVTLFMKAQCIDIMKSFVSAYLPKLGFNCHMPREVIFGAYRYGGFQFAHLYFQQGYLVLKHLLGHIRESTITGNQIIIALSHAQIFSGSGHPLLFEVGTKKDYVPVN